MKQYILGRLLRSLFSIFIVTILVHIIVFTMIPKNYIFQQDAAYGKNTSTPDKKINYENTRLADMGYIDYWDSKDLLSRARSYDSSITSGSSAANQKKLKAYLSTLSGNWSLGEFKEGGYYASRTIPIYERIWKFYSGLIEIDHPWRIQDSSNPDLNRYIKIANDKSVGWSLIGSGTKHKYLIYFNASFPYIHQNLVIVNLGVSYPNYASTPVLDVISKRQGQAVLQPVHFPSGGVKLSSVDIGSRVYQTSSAVSDQTRTLYGDDPYTKTETLHKDPSMLTSSIIIGLAGLLIAYAVSIPLAAFMVRCKNRLFDNISAIVLTFLMALPSIALIYILRYIGNRILGLPLLFTQYGAQDWRSYILPVLSLGISSIPSITIWVRRHFIDQESSNYVAFARSKGLSGAEVLRKHILKNAIIPIVSGIPGAVLGIVGGAVLIESLFAFPGMGKLLLDSIRMGNSAMVMGIVFIFTIISVLSTFIGDVFLISLDPRIKLSEKGGD